MWPLKCGDKTPLSTMLYMKWYLPIYLYIYIQILCYQDTQLKAYYILLGVTNPPENFSCELLTSMQTGFIAKLLIKGIKYYLNSIHGQECFCVDVSICIYMFGWIVDLPRKRIYICITHSPP